MQGVHGLLSVRDYGPAYGSHAHDLFQVLLGLEGALELEVEGRGQRVLPGAGCVIAPGDRHDFEAQGSARCLVLDTAAPEWASAAAQPAHAPAALALARYLQHALADPGGLAHHYGPLLLLDCWRSVKTPSARQRRIIDWRGLTRWCDARLHTPLTVADMAAQVFLSPTQFALRCLQETGMRPMAWLRDQRLRRALHLRTQGLGMAEVASRCGYQSASALGAALRAYRAH
jgi:AraC-like DNA-binding protein